MQSRVTAIYGVAGSGNASFGTRGNWAFAAHALHIRSVIDFFIKAGSFFDRSSAV